MTHSLLNRPDRLAALRQTALLDTPPEEGFDRLTRMAARLLGASTSLIALVAADRQFFKSAIGLPEPLASQRVAPLSFSFCSTVVSTGEPLIVEDARRHPLLRHSPAVRELGWVSYAGVPLITREGHVVGSFCVVDRMPRLWSERDIALLQDLAASAITEIELRQEIANRRQAEQGRQDTEEQLHSSIEQIGIGVGLITLDGRWLRVNRALAEFLESSPDELVGLPAESRTYPDDVASDREASRLLLAGESRSYTMEKRYVTVSGRVVWALVNVALATGSETQPAHFITTVQDITDRKATEAALEEREERYRLLIQVSLQSVRGWDLATDKMEWDRGTVPPLDYQWGDVAETTDWWYQRIHPDDRERVVASLDQAIAAGERTWSQDYRFRRADGRYAMVADRGAILADSTGRPFRVVASLVDLSDADRQRRQLQQAMDVLPFGVWLLDPHGRVVLTNGASQELWGKPTEAAEALAAARACWASTGELLRLEDWAGWRAILRGETVLGQEILVDAVDGARRTIRSSAVPMRGAEGELIGGVVISEDVTDERAREQAERQQSEQLQQTQRMEAVGRLAGGIAHDFNNLLTGILSYSDLILQELRPSDPLREDVEQIRDAAQRAAGLTRQLLAFSRRQLLNPRVVSLNLTVTELEPMFRRLLGPEVTLETHLDPDLGNIVVDPGQLEQVLLNLILNARDAMRAGGQVSLSTMNAELNGEAYVAIRVSDTGVGMEEEIQPRIFEPFFTTKHTGAGRGLGLSTVYGIVEQSGGRISVESVPGQGATFTIYFPRHWGVEPAIGTATQQMPQVGTETLLLVEDEAAVRSSVRRLLEWHGYTVLEARNGAEALRVYEAHSEDIDLVLTDVVMPEMGGHELIERLRQRHPELRVLFMSGYAERALTHDGSVPSGTGYLEKPFTVETLMRRLREVLDA
jgi:two-component system, cell cycle sensor histidine kinase and response regulator CckA